MKKEYSVVMYNNDTRVMVFDGAAIVTNYSKLPKRIVEDIADKLELYLHAETSYYTGKTVYKAGKIINENGGIVNLFSTTSRAAFNRFVCNYVNTK